jgi:hypothetical protein
MKSFSCILIEIRPADILTTCPSTFGMQNAVSVTPCNSQIDRASGVQRKNVISHTAAAWILTFISLYVVEPSAIPHQSLFLLSLQNNVRSRSQARDLHKCLQPVRALTTELSPKWQPFDARAAASNLFRLHIDGNGLTCPSDHPEGTHQNLLQVVTRISSHRL